MERKFKGLKLEGGGQEKVLKELRKQQRWIERGLKSVERVEAEVG
jgi:hypothetical protein